MHDAGSSRAQGKVYVGSPELQVSFGVRDPRNGSGVALPESARSARVALPESARIAIRGIRDPPELQVSFARLVGSGVGVDVTCPPWRRFGASLCGPSRVRREDGTQKGARRPGCQEGCQEVPGGRRGGTCKGCVGGAVPHDIVAPGVPAVNSRPGRVSHCIERESSGERLPSHAGFTVDTSALQTGRMPFDDLCYPLRIAFFLALGAVGGKSCWLRRSVKQSRRALQVRRV